MGGEDWNVDDDNGDDNVDVADDGNDEDNDDDSDENGIGGQSSSLSYM